MEYSYLADGTRTAALDSDGEGLVYRGPFTYRRSASGALTLEAAACPEGLLTDGEVLLHVTDHLGSTMAVMRGSDGALYEASEYDAYGKRSSLTVSGAAALPDGVTLRAGFTGKEDQTPDFGIGYTDFGARLYSPASRRWMVPDPLSEKYYGISPYAYCAGNPVSFVDPDGRERILAMIRTPNGKDVKYAKQANGMKALQNDLKLYNKERSLIDTAQTAPDYDNIVTVYAHGVNNGTSARLYMKDNTSQVVTAQKLSVYLNQKSSLINKNGRNSIIVLTICKSGINEQSLGSNLSEEMKGSLIIAPDSNVNATGSSSDKNGKWNIFLKGKIVDSFDASSDSYRKKMLEINQNFEFYLRKYVE